jgi:hypothetical protein
MCGWMEDGIDSAIVERMEVDEVKPPCPMFETFDQLPTE